MHLLYFVTCCPSAESPERRGLWEVPRFCEGHKGKQLSCPPAALASFWLCQQLCASVSSCCRGDTGQYINLETIFAKA